MRFVMNLDHFYTPTCLCLRENIFVSFYDPEPSLAGPPTASGCLRNSWPNSGLLCDIYSQRPVRAIFNALVAAPTSFVGAEHPVRWTSLHMATVVSNVNSIQSIGVLRPTQSPRPAGPGWWMSTAVLRVLFGKLLLWQWQLISVLGIQSSHMSCRLRSTTTSGHCRYTLAHHEFPENREKQNHKGIARS